ncbi:TPA: hypothetical protein NI674_006241 [Pseudomonas aeruginosa]|uniref:hypothetical protein n=1 Tax=Pseudomonas aeruginosa group TaxID=136841 RepID=UPI0012D991FE|nr:MULTISPECIES: hypothetical protein [Pseudomonas aeruginosa group]MBH9459199.1 hypothetical protein [Pseudomonas aeruginosa]MBH9465960.1 hypothetical protein [Pseudomonas aeruginosa]MUI47045.1 hypothetical protein [Pseudomonas aeruginosa]QPZ62100.1 hypothetical protein I9X26_12140 [Pseudomonas aeruginosa]HCF0987694.1 hypothetical protein [Pseudomonas aeruginosa]
MHVIENDGQAIAGTNYWESKHAAAGYAFLSWNAGAGRIMLPDALAPALADMRAARYVIVSRGPWRALGGREAWELLFEDDSDSPYCLHLVTEQSDRLLPDTDQGGGFVIAVWTRHGEQLRLPGKYRKVREIPCLDPWNTH